MIQVLVCLSSENNEILHGRMIDHSYRCIPNSCIVITYKAFMH